MINIDNSNDKKYNNCEKKVIKTFLKNNNSDKNKGLMLISHQFHTIMDEKHKPDYCFQFVSVIPSKN